MSDPSRVRVSGPLEPFAAGFAAALQLQGYTPGSACHQMYLFAHLSRWLAEEHLDAHALEPATVERFAATRRAAGYVPYTSAKALRPLLAHLRGLGVAPAPLVQVQVQRPQGLVEELLERYRCYLTVERGLGAPAARGYVSAVRPFLVGRLRPAGLELESLDAAQIMSFVRERAAERSRGRAKMTVTALRSLLAFLHVEGVIREPLGRAVPSVAGYRLQGLPKRLTSAELDALLSSCDRDAAAGRRDFAILTLLARLGLRRGEVANLCLDDIDWRTGELVVRGKPRRSERLPLPADVGQAIVAYLRDGRPHSAMGRALFVSLRAPHRPLGSQGVSELVVAAARRAGLRHIHAHQLRHTAASEMLRAGASLVEVGQVLRHRGAASTAIYAKVDREALRAIVRPWLGGCS
jgi:integrase/recombinase XerD